MPKLGQHLKPRTSEEPNAVQGARWIALTKGMFALVDAADFERLNKFSWVYHAGLHCAFRRAPSGTTPAQIFMHREVLEVVDAGVLVDHRFGVRLDNRRANLRLANAAQNMWNNRGRAVRLGPFKGVHPTGRKSKPWAAKITLNYRTVNLGRFVTPEEAAKAYDAAAVRHFGDFARLNFPPAEWREQLRASEELFS